MVASPAGWRNRRPTDPVAVIALFQQLGVPDRLKNLVEGESIFNDGTAGAAYELVLAVLLPTLGLAEVSGNPTFVYTPAVGIAGEVLWLIFGGLLLGFAVGWIASHLVRRIDDRLVVITITVAVAYGMYLLGTALLTSGLLAVVGAGLVMGSYGRKNAMSPRTIEAADDVWEFINYLANSLLFLLLGFELAFTHIAQSFPGIILWLARGRDGPCADDLRVHPIAGCPGSLVGTPNPRMAFQISSPTFSSIGMATCDGAFGPARRAFACTGAEFIHRT